MTPNELSLWRPRPHRVAAVEGSTEEPETTEEWRDKNIYYSGNLDGRNHLISFLMGIPILSIDEIKHFERMNSVLAATLDLQTRQRRALEAEAEKDKS